MARVLVVEDEGPIRAYLKSLLERLGHDVRLAPDGSSGLEALRTWRPDALLLDLDLGPGPQGEEVCRTARASDMGDSLAILVLTGKAGEAPELALFDAGADDYLRKGTFDIDVFRLRLDRLLERMRRPAPRTQVLTVGSLTMDPARFEAHIHGKPLQLSPTEYLVLHRLATGEGQAVRRGELFELCHGVDENASSRAVDVHIKQIRKKLGEYRGLICSIYGVGYRIDTDV